MRNDEIRMTNMEGGVTSRKLEARVPMTNDEIRMTDIEGGMRGKRQEARFWILDPGCCMEERYERQEAGSKMRDLSADQKIRISVGRILAHQDITGKATSKSGHQRYAPVIGAYQRIRRSCV